MLRFTAPNNKDYLPDVQVPAKLRRIRDPPICWCVNRWCPVGKTHYIHAKLFCPYQKTKKIFFVRLSQNLIPGNSVKQANPRNTKGSGCQKGNRIQTDINWRISRKNPLVDEKNQEHTKDGTNQKKENKRLKSLLHNVVSYIKRLVYYIK